MDTPKINTSSHIRTSRRRKGQRMTTEERTRKQDDFLSAFANTANVRAACMRVEIDRSTVYDWMKQETFAARFREAEEEANDLLFAEAWNRAMKGDEEYVVSMGKIVYGEDGKPLKVRKKSDRLLELMMRARIPAFKPEQKIEHVGKDGGPIETKVQVHVFLPDDEEE